MNKTTPHQWAPALLSHAMLGDPSRTRCLVNVAGDLAHATGKSRLKSSQTSADIEGAYRLVRNPAVAPEDIAEAGFNACARQAKEHALLLALEDTTSGAATPFYRDTG